MLTCLIWSSIEEFLLLARFRSLIKIALLTVIHTFWRSSPCNSKHLGRMTSRPMLRKWSSAGSMNATEVPTISGQRNSRWSGRRGIWSALEEEPIRLSYARQESLWTTCMCSRARSSALCSCRWTRWYRRWRSSWSKPKAASRIIRRTIDPKSMYPGAGRIYVRHQANSFTLARHSSASENL